jgi:hypothetical protein
MAGGEWNTTRERKQLAADARELEREQVRLAKRMLRDLRWSAERSRLKESDWTDLLTLHHQYGKEGPSQLWLELIPYWSQSQRLNGGVPCPDVLQPDWIAEIKAEINCKKSAHDPVTRPKTPPVKPPVLRENHVRTPAKPAPATKPAHLKHLANHG